MCINQQDCDVLIKALGELGMRITFESNWMVLRDGTYKVYRPDGFGFSTKTYSGADMHSALKALGCRTLGEKNK